MATRREVKPSSVIEITGEKRKDFSIEWTDKTPSWKRYFEGRTHARFRASTHVNRHFLEITGEESAQEKKPNAKWVTKQVYLNLDEQEAQEFYAWLKSIFEQPEELSYVSDLEMPDIGDEP